MRIRKRRRLKNKIITDSRDLLILHKTQHPKHHHQFLCMMQQHYISNNYFSSRFSNKTKCLFIPLFHILTLKLWLACKLQQAFSQQRLSNSFYNNNKCLCSFLNISNYWQRLPSSTRSSSSNSYSCNKLINSDHKMRHRFKCFPGKDLLIQRLFSHTRSVSL